jgi:hypothetical protein
MDAKMFHAADNPDPPQNGSRAGGIGILRMNRIFGQGFICLM